ncbi:Clavaminate synthase-like protein [Aspergillus sclerotiicarbonarius CBS 121057]|uniref:Clavaminate synthase-like protein n=1 Tax=Aspergillus sclerotiicarbonarius (strain CBS 121057 / IBT 28362) TaxID=1448318 RepID=A0A319EWT6_ASPSB|nr:Clavaminate synthase-like protein [Aspergillus sclerotiicarbonarius CBS 121057]
MQRTVVSSPQTRALFPAIDFVLFRQGKEPQVKELLQRYGAFRIRNHGLSSQVKESCFGFAKGFFNQPTERKRNVSSFSGFECETVRGSRIPKESLYVSRTELERYPPVSLLYKEMMDQFMPELLESLSQALDLRFSLQHYHKSGDDTIALHHYPMVEGVERNPAHQDFGLLTLLIQEDAGTTSGLEIADLQSTDKKGSSSIGASARFVPVEPGENEITVFVGNMLPKLARTNQCDAVLRSCVHRVASGDRERYSIACFVHADSMTILDEKGITARGHLENWISRSQAQGH